MSLPPKISRVAPPIERLRPRLQQPEPPPGLLREYWPVAVFIVAAVIAWMASR